MRYLVMALGLVALCACGDRSLAQKKVVIIGSSTSACYFVGYTTDCYVLKVQSYYNTTPPNNDTLVDNGLARIGYTVYRGMPSSYISPYTDANFKPDPTVNITMALSLNPDVVLVNYPTNGYDVIPLDSILYCLRTIRDSANKKGIPCFVTTSQPRTDGSFNTSAMKRKLADIKDSVLLEFGSFALDFYTGMIDTDSSILPIYRATPGGIPDFIHYNGAGHTILAQRVEAANMFSATVALPATFLSYSASFNGNATLINWSTAKEIDVAHYEIQRSGDGTTFIPLGELDPNNGSGIYSYQYTDRQPLQGWSYYKIVIVDRDGKKQYSPVFKAFNNAARLSVRKLMTQPSQVVLELQSKDAQQAGLQVVNSTGMLLQRSTQRIDAGISTITVNTATLSSGVYYIKLITAAGPPIIASFIKN